MMWLVIQVLLVVLQAEIVLLQDRPYMQVPGSEGCWGTCGNKGGKCESICQTDGYCCRQGYDDCPPSIAALALSHRHSCLVPAVPYMQVPGSEGCWGTCGNKGGKCESICETDGYCCRQGYDDCPASIAALALSHRHSCLVPAAKKESSTFVGCGGNVLAGIKKIKFPEKGKYGNNLRCTWNLNIGQPFYIKVKNIDIERGANCKYDYLQFGGNKYCTGISPSSDISVDNGNGTYQFTFHSDRSASGNGFEVEIIEECSYTVGGKRKGESCVFPFTFKGREYKECSSPDNDPKGNWCATKVDSKGLMDSKHWGYCKSGCPKTCKVDGKHYADGERFIMKKGSCARCTCRVTAKGTGYGCVPVCGSAGIRCESGFVMRYQDREVSWAPGCSCPHPVCEAIAVTKLTYYSGGKRLTYNEMESKCTARDARFCYFDEICPQGGPNKPPVGGQQASIDMWVPIRTSQTDETPDWVQVGTRSGGMCNTHHKHWGTMTSDEKPWKDLYACCPKKDVADGTPTDDVEDGTPTDFSIDDVADGTPTDDVDDGTPTEDMDIEIDECATSRGGCQHECHDTITGYSCSCWGGFALRADNHTCEEVDECATNNGGCSGTCVNKMGSFACGCEEGFVLASDKKTCDDINECIVKKGGGCAQLCENIPGSFRCNCQDGYKLNKDGKTCDDINECIVKKGGGCTQLCENFPGSYRCNCQDGYKLKKDKKTCDDINECVQLQGGGCVDGTCKNTLGSYYCSCSAGYTIASDGKVCEDVNECDDNKGGCSHTCANIKGSFTCSCRKGFELEADGRTCKKHVEEEEEDHDHDTPQRDPPPCTNTDRRCKKWAKRNYCMHKKYYRTMLKKCSKACRFCTNAYDCGSQSYHLQNYLLGQRIVGGYNAKIGEFPWQVGIWEKPSTVLIKYPFCGGTLIAPNVVLTAAHCFPDNQWKNPGDYLARVGDLMLSEDGAQEENVEIKQIIIHQKYNNPAYSNDLALLILKKKLKLKNLVQAACLPYKDESISKLTKQTCYVTGWGRTGHAGKQADVLQELRMPIVTRSECKIAFKSWFQYHVERNRQYGGQDAVNDFKKKFGGLPAYVTKKTYCAGYKEGGKDACQGDSGGPLVCKNEFGRYVLRGVVAWGIGCAEKGLYGVYTNVHEYLRWIRKHSNV